MFVVCCLLFVVGCWLFVVVVVVVVVVLVVVIVVSSLVTGQMMVIGESVSDLTILMPVFFVFSLLICSPVCFYLFPSYPCGMIGYTSNLECSFPGFY